MLFVAGFRDRAQKMERERLRSNIRKIPRFGMCLILCIHHDPRHINQSLSADQADSAGYVAMCSGMSETYGHLKPHLPKKLERESQGGTFRVWWQPREVGMSLEETEFHLPFSK